MAYGCEFPGEGQYLQSRELKELQAVPATDAAPETALALASDAAPEKAPTPALDASLVLAPAFVPEAALASAPEAAPAPAPDASLRFAAEGLEADLLLAAEELEAQLAEELAAIEATPGEAPPPPPETPAEPDPHMEMPLEPREPPAKGAGKMHDDFTRGFQGKPSPPEAGKTKKRDGLIRPAQDRIFRFPKGHMLLDSGDKPFDGDERLRAGGSAVLSGSDQGFAQHTRKGLSIGSVNPDDTPSADPYPESLAMAPLALDTAAGEKDSAAMFESDGWNTPLDKPPSQAQRPDSPDYKLNISSMQNNPSVQGEKTREKTNKPGSPEQPVLPVQSALPMQPAISKQPAMSKQTALPMQTATPKQPALPKQTILPKQTAAPKQTALPIQAALPMQTATPKQPALPKQTAAPKQTALPKPTTLPIQTALPKQTVLPMQPALPKKEALPKPATLPIQTALPKQPALPVQTAPPGLPEDASKRAPPGGMALTSSADMTKRAGIAGAARTSWAGILSPPPRKAPADPVTSARTLLSMDFDGRKKDAYLMELESCDRPKQKQDTGFHLRI